MFPIRRRASEEIHMTNCLCEKRRKKWKQFSFHFSGKEMRIQFNFWYRSWWSWRHSPFALQIQGFSVGRVNNVCWIKYSAHQRTRQRFYVSLRCSYERVRMQCTRNRNPIDWQIFSYNINLHVIALSIFCAGAIVACCSPMSRWGALQALRLMPFAASESIMERRLTLPLRFDQMTTASTQNTKHNWLHTKRNKKTASARSSNTHFHVDLLRRTLNTHNDA